jgi:uncharacterized protein (TIGR02996 family)
VTQRDAFLQAICENPEDDATRLIYADWLEEHGDDQDAARAEFIRVQIECSRLPPDDPGRADLSRRQAHLLGSHRDTWLRQLPALRGVVWPHRFWRGFISGADVQAWKFYRRHAAALFTATPVQFLRVVGIGAQTCRELAQSTYLGRLLGLELIDTSLGDAGVQALAGCPHLTNLQSLTLPGPARSCFRPVTSRRLVGDTGAFALAASPYLARLTLLNLRDNAVGEEGLRALRERFGAAVRV